jgi:hypothetical protein
VQNGSALVFRGAWITVLTVLLAASSEAQMPATPSQATKPVQRADATPQGKLKNPYSVSDKAIVDSGARDKTLITRRFIAALSSPLPGTNKNNSLAFI